MSIMKTPLTLLAAILVPSILAVACGDLNLDGNTPDSSGSSNDAGDDDAASADDDTGGATGAPTWDNFAKSFAENYCTRCHGSFGTYESMRDNASSAASKVQNGSMPPSSPKPSADEIADFVAWAEAGAPQS